MSSRYLTNVLSALFGGFVVVMSQAARPSTAGWIAFGFGIAVVGIVALAQLDRGRGLVQRVMDVGLVALGGLAIAFGLAASGLTQRWTVFAFALGWVVLGISGLTAHEVAQWRAARGLAQLHWFPSLDRAVDRGRAGAYDRSQAA